MPMAGFGVRVTIGVVLAGLIVAGRIEAGQQPAALVLPAPTLPQFMQAPRILPPIRFAQRQAPPSPVPGPQPRDQNGRPPLPEIRVDPYVVCGMTIIPAPPNVDPKFARPLVAPAGAARQNVPPIRRVPPGVCSIADARPRNPDAPRNR